MIQVHITVDVSNSVYNGLTQPPNNLSCKLDVDVEVPVESFHAWADTIKELKSKKIPSIAWASGTHYLNSVDFYRFRRDQAELEKRIKEAYKRNLGKGVVRIRVNVEKTFGQWIKSTYNLVKESVSETIRDREKDLETIQKGIKDTAKNLEKPLKFGLITLPTIAILGVLWYVTKKG